MEENKKPVEDEELLDPTDFEEETKEDVETDNDDSKEETEEVKTNESKSDEELEKAKRDAHFAKLRREREAREKEAKERRDREEKERRIRAEAKLEGELGMVKTNPYTDEPIHDEEDLKIYKLQRELEEEGRDPVTDLPRKIAEENRKAAKKAAEEKATKERDEVERQKKIDAEIKELREKYPKLDTTKLAEDPLYKECMNGRVGRWSLTEIYELYVDKKAESERKAEEEKTKKSVDEASKKMTKTPSSVSSKATASSISSMSDEEFEKYWKEHYQ